MKMVAKTFISKEKYIEFNRIHNSLNPFWTRFIMIVGTIGLAGCFICFSLFPHMLIITIIEGNMASFGVLLIDYGTILISAVFLCIYVCIIDVAACFFREQDCICEFTEEQITQTVTNRSKAKIKKFSYDKVKKVVDKNGLVLIYFSSFAALVVDKNGFEEGSAEELKLFLKTRNPNLKIIEV